MKIKAGFSLSYDCPKPTPMMLALSIHPSRRQDLLSDEILTFSPEVEAWDYTDGFGNVCTRLTAPPGRLTVSTTFEIYDSGLADIVPHGAAPHDIRDLPDETLVFLLASRYCETDRLASFAWATFGSTPPGWPRVQAILDFTHNHIAFNYRSADSARSAYGAYLDGRGVCRDFAHLGSPFAGP